ncbi:hypothetical protein PBI_YUNGJAMAL_77 [Mycobacterium phage YungJamal]|uniref:Uncharacterized protein n=1 Tax=Mycobacterium phage YungJamal TaxID=1505226 RepID=A0A076G874_BPMCO|nr:hypothetical protein PBI_YUNGJAMAL_77 [Mycobacterium phage YungJamal]
MSVLAEAVTQPTGVTPAVATIIVAVVTVLGGVVGAIVSYWLNRNNNSADTAEKISRAWVPVFTQYDTALEQVQKQCDACRKELNEAAERWRVAEERATDYERRLTAAEQRERTQTEVLRTLVRVYDANDPTEIEAAITQIRQMLRG